MDIIHLLPDSVANQIAAGEVIQRPASVVKELVENSIDAGATLVKVIIKGSGRTSIQVIDDGKGMSATDARLAFERHATSKIQQATDLFSLSTMGFRGEALASIVAVAQVELRTRRKEDELGTFIELEGSKVLRQEVDQCPVGTRFIVKNLFFNIPARRKFLKSDETEMRNILQEMQRIVLAHPNIAFQLYNGDDLVYDLPSGPLKQRIVTLFNRKVKNISHQLLNIEANTTLVNLSGYVGTPQSAGRNTPQFFFVNGRYMNHPYFRRAVLQAYDRMIAPDMVPQFFINLEVDPASIDVNIHPTKTEIKFENEREIWSIISIAIKEALGKFNIAPSIDFNTEGSVDFPITDECSKPEMPSPHFNSHYNPFSQSTSSSNSSFNTSPRNWQKLFENVQSQPSLIDETFSSNTDVSTDSQLVPGNGEEQDTMMYKGKFLCVTMKSGLMLIDIQRAMTRIYYDELFHMVEKQRGVTQKLLFPEVLELTIEDKCLFTEIEIDLRNLGFEMSEFGKCMYKIEGVPALLSDSADVLQIIDLLLKNIKEGGADVKNSIQQIIIQTIAQSASQIKINKRMNEDERSALIGQLFASSNPNNTPNGKKIINIISDETIDSMF